MRLGRRQIHCEGATAADSMSDHCPARPVSAGSRTTTSVWIPGLIHRILATAVGVSAYSRSAVARHPKRVAAVVAAMLASAGGLAVAALAPDASDLPVQQVLELVQPLPLSLQSEMLENHALRLYRSDLTRSTDSPASLLRRLGIDDPAAAAYLGSSQVARQALFGHAGRNVSAEVSDGNSLLKLYARWSPDDSGTFKRLVVEKNVSGFSSSIETAPLTASSKLAGGTIQSSLFAATDDARIPDSVAVQLAEIFAGDIDFLRGLRKGDRFSVVYETLEGDGEPMRSGRVLSAEFVNNGKTYQALWFRDPSVVQEAGRERDKGGYYALDGQTLRRSFLASPMEFSRVTSGFKMRFHPVLQQWRAHQGVDYAETTGTPVRNVGDGVVEFAGMQRGYGNVVFVGHRNQITTVYAHLSRIDVKRGQPVSQSQVIGAVGATGWVTGPHLHFEYRVNGSYQDPATIAQYSATASVSVAAKPAFDRVAASARLLLSAAGSVRQVSTQ